MSFNLQVELHYTNWRNITTKRMITPHRIFFGSNEFHKEPQWLLEAMDEYKQEIRYFAMKDIHFWKPSSQVDSNQG